MYVCEYAPKGGPHYSGFWSSMRLCKKCCCLLLSVQLTAFRLGIYYRSSSFFFYTHKHRSSVNLIFLTPPPSPFHFLSFCSIFLSCSPHLSCLRHSLFSLRLFLCSHEGPSVVYRNSSQALSLSNSTGTHTHMQAHQLNHNYQRHLVKQS